MCARDARAATGLRHGRLAPATSTPLHQHVPGVTTRTSPRRQESPPKTSAARTRARGGPASLPSRVPRPAPRRNVAASRARDRSRAAPRPTRRARFTRRGIFPSRARAASRLLGVFCPPRGDARGSPRRAAKNVPLLTYLRPSDPLLPSPPAGAPSRQPPSPPPAVAAEAPAARAAETPAAPAAPAEPAEPAPGAPSARAEQGKEARRFPQPEPTERAHSEAGRARRPCAAAEPNAPAAKSAAPAAEAADGHIEADDTARPPRRSRPRPRRGGGRSPERAGQGHHYYRSPPRTPASAPRRKPGSPRTPSLAAAPAAKQAKDTDAAPRRLEAQG